MLFEEERRILWGRSVECISKTREIGVQVLQSLNLEILPDLFLLKIFHKRHLGTTVSAERLKEGMLICLGQALHLKI